MSGGLQRADRLCELLCVQDLDAPGLSKPALGENLIAYDSDYIALQREELAGEGARWLQHVRLDVLAVCTTAQRRGLRHGHEPLVARRREPDVAVCRAQRTEERIALEVLHIHGGG